MTPLAPMPAETSVGARCHPPRGDDATPSRTESRRRRRRLGLREPTRPRPVLPLPRPTAGRASPGRALPRPGLGRARAPSARWLRTRKSVWWHWAPGRAIRDPTRRRGRVRGRRRASGPRDQGDPGLVEQLAGLAADAGIERFVAEVLPSNLAMLQVFERVGFEVAREWRAEWSRSFSPSPRLSPTGRSSTHARPPRCGRFAATVLRSRVGRRARGIAAGRRSRPGLQEHRQRRVPRPRLPGEQDGADVAGVKGYGSLAELPSRSTSRCSASRQPSFLRPLRTPSTEASERSASSRRDSPRSE